MESYYEFNVSLNGFHLFATAPRSFPDCQPKKAKEFYALLCSKFPESEGYKVDMYHWSIVGHMVITD